MAQLEDQAFIEPLANAAVINDSTSWQVDLATIKSTYGRVNFNFLVALNLHTAQKVFILLDGKSIPFPANGGTLGIDPLYNFRFSDIEVKNSSGAQIPIGAIQLTIGRMFPK